MIPVSYSFLNDFANCPHKAFRRYVKRDLPYTPETPEQREGNTTHKLLERYLNDDIPARLPVSLEPFALPLKRRGAKAEVRLGMTEGFLPAGFSADGAWLKGKADVLVVEPPRALIVDWKTGKVKEDDRELRTLALLVRANYSEVSKITGFYVWLKEGRIGKEYDLTDVNRTYHAVKAAVREAEEYQAQDHWPCKPNALCSWCPVAGCRFNSNPSFDNSAKPAMPLP